MRNLLKSFNTLMTNTKVEMKMEGWPATVSVLGIKLKLNKRREGRRR